MRQFIPFASCRWTCSCPASARSSAARCASTRRRTWKPASSAKASTPSPTTGTPTRCVCLPHPHPIPSFVINRTNPYSHSFAAQVRHMSAWRLRARARALPLLAAQPRAHPRGLHVPARHRPLQALSGPISSGPSARAHPSAFTVDLPTAFPFASSYYSIKLPLNVLFVVSCCTLC